MHYKLAYIVLLTLCYHCSFGQKSDSTLENQHSKNLIYPQYAILEEDAVLILQQSNLNQNKITECQQYCFDQSATWYWEEFWLLQSLEFDLYRAHELSMLSANSIYLGCITKCN